MPPRTRRRRRSRRRWLWRRRPRRRRRGSCAEPGPTGQLWQRLCGTATCLWPRLEPRTRKPMRSRPAGRRAPSTSRPGGASGQQAEKPGGENRAVVRRRNEAGKRPVAPLPDLALACRKTAGDGRGPGRRRRAWFVSLAPTCESATRTPPPQCPPPALWHTPERPVRSGRALGPSHCLSESLPVRVTACPRTSGRPGKACKGPSGGRTDWRADGP